jgi:PAS domain-containing protein
MTSAYRDVESAMDLNRFRRQFTDIEDACAPAQAIVDTVREAVLVLDKDLRVIAAIRSFYLIFNVKPQDTQERLLRELGDGQWDVASLRLLLEKIIPEHGVMEDYEVEHDFPGVGHRTMRLNARHNHPARHRGRHQAARLGARNGGVAAAASPDFGGPGPLQSKRQFRQVSNFMQIHLVTRVSFGR